MDRDAADSGGLADADLFPLPGDQRGEGSRHCEHIENHSTACSVPVPTLMRPDPSILDRVCKEGVAEKSAFTMHLQEATTMKRHERREAANPPRKGMKRLATSKVVKEQKVVLKDLCDVLVQKARSRDSADQYRGFELAQELKTVLRKKYADRLLQHAMGLAFLVAYPVPRDTDALLRSNFDLDEASMIKLARILDETTKPWRSTGRGIRLCREHIENRPTARRKTCTDFCRTVHRFWIRFVKRLWAQSRLLNQLMWSYQ